MRKNTIHAATSIPVTFRVQLRSARESRPLFQKSRDPIWPSRTREFITSSGKMMDNRSRHSADNPNQAAARPLTVPRYTAGRMTGAGRQAASRRLQNPRRIPSVGLSRRYKRTNTYHWSQWLPRSMGSYR
ncbi:hypothetical protein VTK56DRAFT_687 [Thermocarpiscus australiensis]